MSDCESASPDSELQKSGFIVDQTRRAGQFARLHVPTSDGRQLDVDLGVDWRRDDPVSLDNGSVLSLGDAVASKISALHSRGEHRRDSGRSSIVFGSTEGARCQVRLN